MRVALECSTALAHRLTGIQRYVIELVRALAALDEPDLGGRVLLRLGAYRKRRLKPALPWPTRWYASGPWPAVPLCDIVHALDMRLPRTPSRMARICTLHDVFALTLPRYGSKRNVRNTIKHYRYAVRRADRIIAVSEAARQEFIALFDYAPDRISVVHHGLSADFLAAAGAQAPPRAAPARRSYLAFGGTPRKNLDRILAAFATAEAARDAVLEVVGPPAPASLDAVRRLGLGERVRFLGDVDDRSLAALYGAAAGLLFPSLQEGFGIPILEAMACGAPVLTSEISAMPEVAGGHAVLVDPASVDAIADGIDRLAAVTPAERAAAAAYAATFTWERAARKTLDVYRSV